MTATANKDKDLQKCMTTFFKDNVAMMIGKVKEERCKIIILMTTVFCHFIYWQVLIIGHTRVNSFVPIYFSIQ